MVEGKSMLDQQDIEERIKKAVCESIRISEEIYNYELAAGDIPEWDSIGHVTLLQAVEAEFEIAFDVGDAIDIEDVEDLVAMVKKYFNGS